MYGAKYVVFPERNLRHMILHDTMDLCIHLLSFQIAEMKTTLWLNVMEAIICSLMQIYTNIIIYLPHLRLHQLQLECDSLPMVRNGSDWSNFSSCIFHKESLPVALVAEGMIVCSVTDAHCSSLNIEILNMKLQLENETCLDFHLSLFYLIWKLYLL